MPCNFVSTSPDLTSIPCPLLAMRRVPILYEFDFECGFALETSHETGDVL